MTEPIDPSIRAGSALRAPLVLLVLVAAAPVASDLAISRPDPHGRYRTSSACISAPCGHLLLNVCDKLLSQTAVSGRYTLAHPGVAAAPQSTQRADGPTPSSRYRPLLTTVLTPSSSVCGAASGSHCVAASHRPAAVASSCCSIVSRCRPADQPPAACSNKTCLSPPQIRTKKSTTDKDRKPRCSHP